MIYPYLFYSEKIPHAPVFADLEGAPLVADLSCRNPLLSKMDARDQVRLQRQLENDMAEQGRHWGVAGYLERRDSLLRDCPQMVAEARFYHLGLDVIVPLGTPLHAPLDGTVETAGYEEGEGNYGGYLLLCHQSPLFETFYSFYGHLNPWALPEPGSLFEAGEPFARIGDFSENGNWFYHTHIQILTRKGFDEGYISKGYCAAEDLGRINDLCPSPIPLFRV